jgi:hypothetical protein
VAVAQPGFISRFRLLNLDWLSNPKIALGTSEYTGHGNHEQFAKSSTFMGSQQPGELFSCQMYRFLFRWDMEDIEY